jgi:hypothetical protein
MLNPAKANGHFLKFPILILKESPVIFSPWPKRAVDARTNRDMFSKL